MNFNQMNIGKQLKIGFLILALLMGLMSVFTLWQTYELSRQTELLYGHPLQVRRALDNIKINQQKMSVAILNMQVADSDESLVQAYDLLLGYKAEIPKYMDILDELYLGPEEDIVKINTSYILWEEMVLRNASLLLQGEQVSVKANMKPGSEYDLHTEVLQESFDTVDIFAKQKADYLYQTSEQSRKDIIVTNFALFATFMIIVYVLSRRIYSNVQDPLRDLVGVIKEVDSGNLSERSSISLNNEFGELATGLNGMLISIENNVKLNEKSASLSEIMLADDHIEIFFESLLSGLLNNTNGQLGGVYLLDEAESTYELFVSIGMDKNKRIAFDRASLEGELGLAMGSRKIQVLKQVSESTRFVYPAAMGNLLPKELITIPIMNQDRIIAFITLGSVVGFSELTLVHLEEERTVMSTRIQSVIDIQQKKMNKEKLEMQNTELEAQKAELDALSTELKEQNHELEQQKEELSEANRLKTNFLSNMSHELRTPLNSVIALSGVLERRLRTKISEEESSYLEVIGRSGKNLLEMINEILDISRIESGREELDLYQFDLNDLVGDVFSMLAPLAEEKGIELKYRNDGQENLIMSDEKKIRHIIQNLLSNAVKFTDQGSVEIAIEIDSDQVKFTVTDTGIGILEENKDSIFEEFRQADSSTTRMYGGTGLGLAIVKKYTEFLKGTISVDSNYGEGSIFTVIIPQLHLPDEGVSQIIKKRYDSTFEFSSAVLSNTKVVQNDGRLDHLLIVEDSEPAVIQLRDVFEEEGYRVTVARNGYEAIQMIAESQPDGIILDLMMPKIDGFTVLQTIRESELTAKIPVLVLSAKHITKDELSQLKHNHVYQLIQKGNINLTKLKYAVSTMIHPIEPPSEPIQKVVFDQAKKPVVLVVEDNPDNMLTARAVLSDQFIVIEAEDGETAVRMAADHIPDIILMDNALPGMDGVEAFKEIRKKSELAHIPVIALTASALTTDREIFLAYGFDAFISKPIIEEELVKAIKGVLYGF
ncbi:hypothetical protein SANA_03670 [Gottschalkiaceae bacterium SANA]|nr:hypothetical protein SANA_03670 [Gottschalkiaceae bacterium SANA]